MCENKTKKRPTSKFITQNFRIYPRKRLNPQFRFNHPNSNYFPSGRREVNTKIHPPPPSGISSPSYVTPPEGLPRATNKRALLYSILILSSLVKAVASFAFNL